MNGFIKKAVAGTAGALGLWRLGYSLARIRHGNLLAVFTFHRITNCASSATFLANYDRGTSAAAFKSQIQAITKFYRVIDLREFTEIVSGSRPARRGADNCALLTFDDADSEFLTAALPVLREQGLPGVIFAPTAYIGTANRFWHLRISSIFVQISPEQWRQNRSLFEVAPEPYRETLLHSEINPGAMRSQLCQQAIWALNKIPERVALKVADELERETGFAYSLPIRCLDWEELKTCERSGVSVESHTVTHSRLTELDDRQIDEQLVESKQLLECRLKKTITAISYPGGYFDARVIASAEQAGYQMGFTTKRGYCQHLPQVSERYALRRFDMRGETRNEALRFLGSLPFRY